MRYLYLLLLLLVLTLGSLLFFYSVPVFVIFVATFPVALCLLWLIAWRFGSASSGSVFPEESSDEALARQTQEMQAARKRFWIRVGIAIFAPILLYSLLTAAPIFLDYLPRYSEYIFLFLMLALGILFVYAIASVTTILLFERYQTDFPTWSILFGILTGLTLVAICVAPLLFLMSGSTGHYALPPPHSFEINQTITMKLDPPNGTITEEYEILPVESLSVSAIDEIRHGTIPQSEVVHNEPFEAGKYENTPLTGIRVSLQRPATVLRIEDLGLFRSRFTFSPQELTLVTHDVRQKRVGAGSTPAGESLYTSQNARVDDSKVELQLPKNSFLAISPEGKFNSLPDKDVVTLSLSRVSQNIEVYYLRRWRFSVVREVLAKSSNHDVIIGFLAFLFWPITALTVGVFQKKVADSIVQGVGRLFRPKAHRQIGFRR